MPAARARRTRRPIDGDLFFELPTVGEPSLRPDGGEVAFVWTEIDRGSREPRSHIRTVAAGAPPAHARPLTVGPKDRSPRWAPDGATLAFLRPAPDAANGAAGNGAPQVWLLSAAGGEALPLTALRAGVRWFTWSPDATTLVCVADVDPDAERPADAPATGPLPRRVNRVYYRADGLGWRGDAHRQLFRVDVASGETKQLTRGDHDLHAPAISPDGRWLAFASSDRSAARGRRIPGGSELCVMPLAGGPVERLVRNLQGVGAIAWSPDGRRLAYASSGPAEHYAQSYLWVIDRAGGEPVRLTDDTIDPVSGGIPLTEPQPLAWVGNRILFLANSHGSSSVHAVTPRARGGRVETLRSERELATAISFSADGTRAALLASTLRQPGEIATVDLSSGEAAPATDASRDYLAAHAVGRTERFTVTRGGIAIDCRLTFPPGFDRRKRYPLVLTVHGGPNGFYGDGWYAGQQLLAAAGYLVLWTNPRGSATYGRDFVQRVFEDWGGEDYLDQMAAVDHVCRRSYVDANRLGVQGYSYGGFMTSWIVGHTDRFRAAVVGAPVTNLVSMYGTTDIAMVFGERQWGGPPWTNREQYIARSPLTYAPQVTAPVLLLHGEADIRCPVAQSEEYYVALKRLGKTVEFVRFPGGYHGFVNSGHVNLRQAYYEHIREWFDRWLR